MGANIFKNKKPKMPALVWSVDELSEIVGEPVERYFLADDGLLIIRADTGTIYLVNPKTNEVVER